ncbi:MAG: FkbM family methyltransferase [Alphaproteobacteria bacterium]|jgi:FkbM family methyltransferase|nr:FkbM family methyltransferase [Alphaproteobacteria bacterium]
MLSFLQATKTKMLVAQFLYRLIRLFGIKDHQIVLRQGIRYELDLKEGIDLRIFLFGNFQKHIYKNLSQKLNAEPIVFDVGANIGSICLNLAQILPDAKIYAIEPTYFAWKKLLNNLALNPTLAKRIVPIQTFVGEHSSQTTDFKAFSSWPIDSLRLNEKKHKIHLGEEKEATSSQISIDDFVRIEKIPKVDFIKIDTDGYELNVLRGAINTLVIFRPLIIFELSTYLLKEKNVALKEYFEFFKKISYTMKDSQTHKTVTMENIYKIIPDQGTVDILAYPCEDAS